MKILIAFVLFTAITHAFAEKIKWGPIITNINGFPIRFTQQEAIITCRDYLHGDWRLPTIEEAERDAEQLYIRDNYGESCVLWSRFSCQGQHYWSSSKKWGGTWIFPIEAGFLKQLVPNTNKYYVRCVTRDLSK